MKFEVERAWNKYKDAHLRGELKQCVPITVQRNTFPLAKKDNVRVERKKFSLVTGHALTIHKVQGTTMEYITGDKDRQKQVLELP